MTFNIFPSSSGYIPSSLACQKQSPLRPRFCQPSYPHLRLPPFPQHFPIIAGHSDHSYFFLKLIPYTTTITSLILGKETSCHIYFHFLPLFPYFIIGNFFQILGSVNYLLILCFFLKKVCIIYLCF